MKIFRLLIVILILTGVVASAAWALGFRFHPEALLDACCLKKRDFYKITLNTGRTVVGEILEESPEGIRLEIGGGSIDLARGEIRSSELISEKDPEFAQFGEWVTGGSAPVLITYRDQDNLLIRYGLIKPENKRGAQRSSAAGPVKSRNLEQWAVSKQQLALKQAAYVRDQIQQMEQHPFAKVIKGEESK